MADSMLVPGAEKGPPAAKNWDCEVRQTFYRLYVLEDKKLSTAIAEIDKLLGFKATYDPSISIKHLLSQLPQCDGESPYFGSRGSLGFYADQRLLFRLQSSILIFDLRIDHISIKF